MTARDEHDRADAAYQLYRQRCPWWVRLFLGEHSRLLFRLGYLTAETDRIDAEQATRQTMIKVYEGMSRE